MQHFRVALLCINFLLAPSVRAMDMSGASSNTSSETMAMMMPYLHFTGGDYLFFDTVVPTSKGAIAGACIALVALGILERSVAGAKGILANQLVHRNTAIDEVSTRTAASQTSPFLGVGPLSAQRPRTVTPFLWTHELARGTLFVVHSIFIYAMMLVVIVLTLQLAATSDRAQAMSSTEIQLETLSSPGEPYSPYRAQTGNSLKNFSTDIEVRSALTDASDPFSFRSAIKTDNELSELRKRNKTGKKLEEYQRGQNNLIGSLLKPMEAHTAEAKEAEEGDRLPVRIAVWASLLSNVVLSALQLYAAISSGSLSLLATCIDSVFDPGSNLVLYWLHKKANKLDTNKWPVGGSRLETIGNISYGALMAAVNLVILVESIRALVDHNGDETNKLHIPSIIAVATAFGVKFALFCYCYALRNSSSQVRMLWEDHRNDLFINGFGILTSAGGAKLKWWLDPMGALVISLGVMGSWGRTIYGEFELLAGKSAPHEFLQLVIYKAATFSDDIQCLDTVRAYHSGPNYFVEVDIVMPADTPLWKAHDVSQQLQDKLETLPGVERAFVHVDHETTHRPEHRKYD